MTWKVSFTCFLLPFIAGSALGADTVYVQLPTLDGLYSVGGVHSRSATFQLERTPLTIYHVWIHIAGTVTVGQSMCAKDPGGPVEGPLPWQEDFEAYIHETGTQEWWGAGELTPDVSGGFEMTDLFTNGFQGSWEFLKTGPGTVTLFGTPRNAIDACYSLVDPYATVNEASVIIEADFQVAVEPVTWGSIKGLFTK